MLNKKTFNYFNIRIHLYINSDIYPTRCILLLIPNTKLHLEALLLFPKKIWLNQFNVLPSNYGRHNIGPRGVYPAKKGVSKAEESTKNLTPWLSFSWD